jgi:hypothetical protein
LTGRGHEHRGDWIVVQLKQLTEAFAINIRAYAVMHNHSHTVVRVDQSDEAGLLTCMSYVDLNPIRSGIANTPETSDFTSIQERITHYHKTLKQKIHNPTEAQTSAPKGLPPFAGGEPQDRAQGLSFSLVDYLELTNWAGRAIRDDKTGAIPAHLAPILDRLNIDHEVWLDTVKNYHKNYYTIVGTQEAIRDFSRALNRKWFCMPRFSSQLYQVAAA